MLGSHLRSRPWLILGLIIFASAAAPAVSTETEEGSTRSFLWRAQRDGRSVYLLGSVHFMKRDSYPLSPPIEAAYAGSHVLVFETDIEGLDRAALRLMAEGALEGGATLRDVVPEELYLKLGERLDELGMSAGAFDRMRPWMVALSLTSLELMRAGYLGSEGIDAHFSARAGADGKERRALETPEAQIALFSALSADESADFLEVTLTELETVIPLVDRIIAAWRAGDVATVEKLLVEGFADHPDLYDRMVTDRNRQWLPAVEELFDGPADAMVVVGALHLIGEESLVELLQARGYEVEQL